MTHKVLLDNWTLQDAGELLADGLGDGSTREMVFTKDKKSYRLGKIAVDVVRFESLCQILNAIVFAEELYVDAKFADAWKGLKSIEQMDSARFLVKKPFLDLEEEWVPAREFIADKLCSNSRLRREHEANKEAFAANGKSKHNFLAQVLWGGAGMLARADYFGLPYVPHPTRAKLFNEGGIVSSPRVAAKKLDQFITSERVKIHKKIDGLIAHVCIPPVVIYIIHEAKDADDIVGAAIRMRNQYKALREWLGVLQLALNKGDLKGLVALEKEFDSVRKNLDSVTSFTPEGGATIQLGVSWFKLNLKTCLSVNAIRNRFGMRAELNRLVLAPTGEGAVRKLIRLFGEGNTSRGHAFSDLLVERFRAPN